MLSLVVRSPWRGAVPCTRSDRHGGEELWSLPAGCKRPGVLSTLSSSDEPTGLAPAWCCSVEAEFAKSPDLGKRYRRQRKFHQPGPRQCGGSEGWKNGARRLILINCSMRVARVPAASSC